MTDIVKRLRDVAAMDLRAGPFLAHTLDTAREAADEIERLRAALLMMVEEKSDYMRINHLGDPEKQHTIKEARKALNRAEGVQEPGKQQSNQ